MSWPDVGPAGPFGEEEGPGLLVEAFPLQGCGDLLLQPAALQEEHAEQRFRTAVSVVTKDKRISSASWSKTSEQRFRKSMPKMNSF
jgi:hypothetical protein